MRIYKKVMNRSIPLISVESWYLGEKNGLAEITEGKFFLKPFFVYTKDKGVAIYYDYSDPNQNPELLAEYFNEHKENLTKLIDTYDKDCQEILKLVTEENKSNFEIIYQLIIKTWPILVVSNIIGGMGKNDKYKEIAKVAYDLRMHREKIIYEAEKYLLRLARQKFPFDQIESASFLLFEELISNEMSSREVIENRKEGYVFYDGSIETKMTLDEFCKINSIEIQKDENEREAKMISGSVACTGVVSGRAMIVFESSQLSKVQEGDILIAPMTTPDFMPAMKRAAAFVTDEGGITCHAAIISREMKKPCIIGTKIATKILKDGDLIEVDADNGMVKILKNYI